MPIVHYNPSTSITPERVSLHLPDVNQIQTVHLETEPAVRNLLSKGNTHKSQTKHNFNVGRKDLAYVDRLLSMRNNQDKRNSLKSDQII